MTRILVFGWMLLRRFAITVRNAMRALLFGFPARNVSIATLIAVSALGRPDFALFGVLFFTGAGDVARSAGHVLGSARLTFGVLSSGTKRSWSKVPKRAAAFQLHPVIYVRQRTDTARKAQSGEAASDTNGL
jgi:hypothetical protein